MTDQIRVVEQTMWSATCPVCGWWSEWECGPAIARRAAEDHMASHADDQFAIAAFPDHCTPDRHVTPHKGCILR